MKNYKLENVLSHRQEGLSWRQIGQIYAEDGEDASVIGERIRGAFRKYRSKAQTHTARGDYSSTRELFDANDLTPDALMERHGFDPTLFELVDSSAYLTDKGVRSRIKVVPRTLPIAEEAFVEAVREAGESLVLPPKAPVSDTAQGTLIVPLFDLHYGKMPTYDAQGADIDTWLRLMAHTACSLSEHYRRCVVLIGQDLFNADTYQLTTTKGTRVRQYMSAEESFKRGFHAMMAFISSVYSVFGEVEVVFTYGNHDRLLGYASAIALEALFGKLMAFTVETAPRVYRLYDNVLVGVTHGSDLVSLSGLMAHEARTLWGQAQDRIWVTGHYHHLTVDEKEGMTIIGVPSPSLQDDWHRDKGYIAQPRGCLIGLSPAGLNEIKMVGA